jgi:hypothetical protein
LVPSPDFGSARLRGQSHRDEISLRLLPFLDEMVDEGLIAMSEVEVIKYVHQDGARS